jgi:hypothetical protein
VVAWDGGSFYTGGRHVEGREGKGGGGLIASRGGEGRDGRGMMPGMVMMRGSHAGAAAQLYTAGGVASPSPTSD